MSDLDFSPPEGLEISLWRSLLINFADRFAPERLPPLQLTSKPVDVGILEGDLLNLPWYRTVFTNLGDVISPETLPPLRAGVAAGGRRRVARRRVEPRMVGLFAAKCPRPPLAPEASAASSHFAAGDGVWGRVEHADPGLVQPDCRAENLPAPMRRSRSRPSPTYQMAATPAAPEPAPAHPGLLVARMQLTRDIVRTRFRRKIWISLAAAEAVFLLVALFKFQ